MERIYKKIVELVELASKMRKNDFCNEEARKFYHLVENCNLNIKQIQDTHIKLWWNIILYNSNEIYKLTQYTCDEFIKNDRYKISITYIADSLKNIKEKLLKVIDPAVQFNEICKEISKISSSYDNCADDNYAETLLTAEEMFIFTNVFFLKKCYEELIFIYQKIKEDNYLKEIVYQMGLILDIYLNTDYNNKEAAKKCSACILDIQDIAIHYLEDFELKR